MSKHQLDDDGAAHGSSKRPKSSNGPSCLPPKGDLASLAGPSTSTQAGSSDAAALAAKRAEVALKFKQMMAKSQGASAAAPAARAPAVPATKAPLSELQKRVAEAKKKVEAMASKTTANPYMASAGNKATPAPVLPGVSLHPLLSGTSETSRPISNKDRYKPMQPKFATTMANARSIVPTPPPVVKMSLEASSAPTLEEARKNPYFDRRLGVESLAPKQRKSRALKFAQKGKFTNLAENLRAEARQQELRERIAAMSQKAGMDNVMDGTERRAKRPPPPEVEWWDAKLLPNETYDDLDTGEAETVIVKEDPEKGISRYVQHPMKIPAPQDKVKVELKPLLLTTKERKKLRRTTRRAEQQDKQDRIRMGLLPPEPPKIKIGNMMRVLTQEAVMDPTKVEARVRREMNQRNDAHVKANEERKLTPAERTAKLAAKVEQDAHRGLQAAVYKIGHLANGGHKFKVIKNAQQHQLTGAILFSPKFVFVLVEGGEKAMRKYSHLLLERIDWAEEEPPAHMPADADFDDPAPKKAGELERDSTNGIAPGENYCTQIWSGMHRERAFDKLRLKSVPSDHLAREWLGQNLEGLWELCRTRVDQSAM